MKIKNVAFALLISLALFLPMNAKAISVKTINNFNVLAPTSNTYYTYDVGGGPAANSSDDSYAMATNDEMDLCSDANFIKLLQYIKIIVNLLMIGTAVALVVRCILVLVKEITSEKAEVDKAIKTVSSKIILACILFLLPALFNWVFFSGQILGKGNSGFAKCIKNKQRPQKHTNRKSFT